jgi:hypothetical protein
MFWDLIATVAAGFMAAGIVLFLKRVLRLPLPKWVLPVAAGASMLGYAIWSEYSWFGRVSEALPPGLVVATTERSAAPWRPWTYAFPIVTRFVTVDRGGTRTHPAAPGQRLTSVQVWTRWQATVTVPVLFDCDGGRAANLGQGADFAADGTVVNADWHDLPENDPILLTACAEE